MIDLRHRNGAAATRHAHTVSTCSQPRRKVPPIEGRVKSAEGSSAIALLPWTLARAVFLVFPRWPEFWPTGNWHRSDAAGLRRGQKAPGRHALVLQSTLSITKSMAPRASRGGANRDSGTAGDAAYRVRDGEGLIAHGGGTQAREVGSLHELSRCPVEAHDAEVCRVGDIQIYRPLTPKTLLRKASGAAVKSMLAIATPACKGSMAMTVS